MKDLIKEITFYVVVVAIPAAVILAYIVWAVPHNR